MEPTETEKLCREMTLLAESWRAKATSIELKYKAASPVMTANLVAAFETCAEEIEALVRETK